MWVNAEAEDELYNKLYQIIYKKQRLFSTVLRMRVFITEYSLNNEDKLLLWERCWVLNSEFLHTEFIQYTHDLTMTEHSKRNVIDVFLLW